MKKSDKKAFLEKIKKTQIPESHWASFQENRMRETNEYRRIAKNQAVKDDDMHKTYSL